MIFTSNSRRFGISANSRKLVPVMLPPGWLIFGTRLHRVVGATNCGHAVNPEQIARQVEGSFVYGLSSLLYGECTVRDGRIEQTNFDAWEVMRLDAMPKIEIVVMPDGEFLGGGRGGAACVAAPAPLH